MCASPVRHSQPVRGKRGECLSVRCECYLTSRLSSGCVRNAYLAGGVGRLSGERATVNSRRILRSLSDGRRAVVALGFVAAIMSRKGGAGVSLRGGLMFVGSGRAHFAAEEAAHASQPEHEGRGGYAVGNHTGFELRPEHRGNYTDSGKIKLDAPTMLHSCVSLRRNLRLPRRVIPLSLTEDGIFRTTRVIFQRV